MSKDNLTILQVRDFLNYDANTGIFTWKRRAARCVQIGDIAGCVEKRIGYASIGLFGHVYKSHRLAWFYIHGEWPIGLIDHINGIKTDNSLINLRIVSAEGNSQNIHNPNKRNKSGFIGVIWFQNKWRASITIKGKTNWLGDFSSPEEAHQVYLSAKRKYHSTCTI